MDSIKQKKISMSLGLYGKDWSIRDTAHLLRRSMFGPNWAQLNEANALGLSGSIDKLLTRPWLSKPIAHLPEEMVVPQGATWVNSVYPTDKQMASYHENARRDSLTAWVTKRLNDDSFSLQEKMCLFWQNHFAATASGDSRATYNYYRLIQENALGNFKTLVKKITIDPCMLMFLNGDGSSSKHPNENYARELLEMYTVGKGHQIEEGNYTNYTEKDIQEGARVLTGWSVTGFLSDQELPNSKFDSAHHDSGKKVFSSCFQSATISNAGEDEYKNYIDLIFEHPETPRFLCRKLYRWFVNYEITEDIEVNIIEKLADLLKEENFEIKPVLKMLLSSEHFFDVHFRGAIVKNPIEFMYSFLNASHSTYDTGDIFNTNNIHITCNNSLSNLGMNYIMPPSVSGWMAYYKEPNYYRLWLNASYIKARFDLAERFTMHKGIELEGNFFEMNLLEFIDRLPNSKNPEQLIDNLALIFLPVEIKNKKRLDELKSILLNGLPAHEWTIEYNLYLTNKKDLNFSDPIKKQIGLTLNRLFQFPEFQLM